MRDRGQAYTLEGLIAALIIASSVLVGLQAVDTTPWTTGSSDAQAEQWQAQADDLLAAVDGEGSLSRAVRCVDDSGGLNPAASELTVLGDRINQSLSDRGLRYRLSLAYWNDSRGVRETRTLAGGGTTPTSDAVTATRRVTLTDNMTTYDINDRSGLSTRPVCPPRGDTLAGSGDFYVPDVNSSSAVYNVVEVRLSVWSEDDV
jgi:hypothetical protein